TDGVIQAQAARADSLFDRERAARSSQQAVGRTVERDWLARGRERTVRRGRQQRGERLPLRRQRRGARLHQRFDQLVLARRGPQDRKVVQDRSESGFAANQAFVCREEEGAVFDDWAAEREAGLVAFEGRVLFQPSGERVTRVQLLISEVVKDIAAERVRPALRDDV